MSQYRTCPDCGANLDPNEVCDCKRANGNLEKQMNRLIQDIHCNAIRHGWWETNRPFAEVIALIHSELSEALEAHRNNKPFIWYQIKDKDCTVCLHYPDGKVCEGDDHHTCPCEAKPEGIVIELADVVIRILDYCGHDGIAPIRVFQDRSQEKKETSLPELVTECHSLISTAYRNTARRPNVAICFGECIRLIDRWCKANGFSLYDAITMKHTYNLTRPYRHGGKAC